MCTLQLFATGDQASHSILMVSYETMSVTRIQVVGQGEVVQNGKKLNDLHMRAVITTVNVYRQQKPDKCGWHTSAAMSIGWCLNYTVTMHHSESNTTVEGVPIERGRDCGGLTSQSYSQSR